MSDILTTPENRSIHNVSSKTEDEDGNGRRVHTPDAGRTGTESRNIHEGKPPAGIQETKEGGKAGQVHREQGEGSSGLRSESNPVWGTPGTGMEPGDTARDTGVRERLEEIGRPSGSPSKDVVLNEAEIGHSAGAASRFDANLDAIYILKQLDKENRPATQEEQLFLAKYSGFGDSAFNPAFDRYSHDASWKRRGEQLKTITTPEEYQAIEKSRLNAFYTTPEIIKTMWEGLRKMGADSIAHPRVLEPSAGSGRFLGFQPADIAARSERSAVELDQMTGRVLKHLYPETAVYVMGFQDAPIAKDSVDIAISNVPFGDYPVYDPEFTKDRYKLTRQIHNYFFAKTLDVLRPGGMLAFITSHNTLDAPSAKPVRELLAEQADLVSAVRLPKGAFPDTEVVTDIIYMRKRLPDEQPGDKSWIDTEEITLKDEDGDDQIASVNQYFTKHPEMVLGKQSLSGSMYRGNEYTVEQTKDKSLSAKLNGAVSSMPANVIKDAPRTEVKVRSAPSPSSVNMHESARVVDEGGTVYIKRNGELQDAKLSDKDRARVKGLLSIRDAARKVLDIQLREGTEEEVKESQKALNEVYDIFVVEHGPLNNSANTEVLKGDPDSTFLKALELHYNKKELEEKTETEKAKQDLEAKRAVNKLITKATVTAAEAAKIKMPIFDKRVVHGYKERAVNSDADAVIVSLNEKGRLDFDRMSELLGQTPDKIKDSLAAKKLIFKNPVGDWEPADQYLSGDVRDKLRKAEAAASAKPEFKVNVEALKAVQPADLTPGQISVRLGSPWVPGKDIDAFTTKLLGVYKGYRRSDAEQSFVYVKSTGEWKKTGKIEGNSARMTEEYGTGRMPADRIIEHILNGQTVIVTDKMEGPDGKEISVRNDKETIAAQEKAAAINKAFQEWIWDDPERSERLAKIYNDTFNNYRPRNYDGRHQELPGISTKWHKWMAEHQKDAIWRTVQDRTALLAHEVGFGKTAVMVGSGMELRRLGLSRKNLYVVPKATHAQFEKEFRDIYPYANILFPSDDDFTPDKRTEFVSRIATGDYDAVILSDSQLRRIPVKPETQAKFLKEEIAALRAALEAEEQSGDDDRYYYRKKKETTSHKEIQKALARAEERLQETMAKVGAVGDKTMYFEDLGVDQMFVDEADNFKNLRFATRMGRIKGLPNTDSDRAWDMYEKVRYLQDNRKGGVVFATGTPVANTIAEMYTMMRYLQRPMLEAKGLQHFDAWAKTFGETTESIEQTATGKYRLTQRFAKFANAPELSNIWQQVADIRVADEVPEIVKKRPRLVDDNGKPRRTVVPVEPDQALLDYMKLLEKRADELGNKDPHEDNMLKISNDARLASLDMRMVDPYAPVNHNGKVATACKNIFDIYSRTTKDKGTQLVFLDIGTPKAKDKDEEPREGEEAVEEVELEEDAKVLRNVYRNIKEQLIANGIPAKDIAFIHDARNKEQRNALQERVNSGDIRVIIGSTGKMGVGLNIQKRAAALHHLDAPWRPRDIEQREGRVIRQGNAVYGPKLDDDGNVIDPGPGVRVYTYVTERSFDAYMWQAIEAKSKAIKSIMRRSAPPRAIEDIDSFTMSAGEAKAIASGNPDVLKSVTLKNQVNRLQMLKSSHVDSLVRAKEQLRNLPHQISQVKDDIAKIERDEKTAKEDKPFAIEVGGKRYSERTDDKGKQVSERPEGSEALREAISKVKETASPADAEEVARYRGFTLKAFNGGPQAGYKIILQNPVTRYEYMTTAIPLSELTAGGAMARIENKINSIPAILDKAKRELAQNEANLKTYQSQADKRFEYENQLTRMEADLSRLEKKLQGEKVEDTPSENYVMPDVDDVPSYKFGAQSEEPKPAETINSKAEIAAVKAEVEPVEKTLEVKPPALDAEKVIEQLSEPLPLKSEGNKPPASIDVGEEYQRYEEERAKRAKGAYGEVEESPVKPVEKPAAKRHMKPQIKTETLNTKIEIGDFIQLKGEIGKGLHSPRGFVVGDGTLGKQNMPVWKIKQADDSITAIPKEDALALGKMPKSIEQPPIPPEEAAEENISHEIVHFTGKKGGSLSLAYTAPRGGQAESRSPHAAEIAGSTPAPATSKRTRAKKGMPTFKDLRRINSERKTSAQIRDAKLKHQVTVEHTNPGVKTWIKHPGNMDVLKVDSPPGVTQPTRPTEAQRLRAKQVLKERMDALLHKTPSNVTHGRINIIKNTGSANKKQAHSKGKLERIGPYYKVGKHGLSRQKPRGRVK